MFEYCSEVCMWSIHTVIVQPDEEGERIAQGEIHNHAGV